MRSRRRRLWRALSVFVAVVVAMIPVSVLVRIAADRWGEWHATAAVARAGGKILSNYRIGTSSCVDRILGTGVFIDLQHCDVGDSDLNALRGFRPDHVFGINLGDTRITDAGLAQVSRFTQLGWLQLGNITAPRANRTRVTDAGLVHLGALKRVHLLSLSDTDVTDLGLAELRGMTGLGSLFLEKTQVRGPGLAHLSALPQLSWLSLCGCHLDEGALRNLENCAHLQSLDLTDTDVGDAEIRQLARIKSLRRLKVEGTHVTQAGAADLLRSLPGLTVVGAPSAAP